MSDSNEVKDYSLVNLEAWVSDSMESGASPSEIHDTIVNTIVKTIKYHRACYREGKELYEQLCNRPYLELVTETVASTRSELKHIPRFDSTRFKLDSSVLHDVEDKPSYEEMIDAGYTMTDDGFWIPPESD